MSTGLRFTLEVDGLPPDAFAVVSFHLNQSLSSLFSLDLSLVSQQFLSLEFAQVLDKMAYLTIWQGDEVQRRVKGVVTWFELGENDKNQMLYSMKVHPPLWRAGLRQNFRIFQNEDIKSILGTMLQENGVTEWSPLFSEPHPSREFCVQYGETDYDFLCRMAAEEGIFFYEEHAYKSTDQSLVLCDTVRHLPESFEIPWNPNTRTEVTGELLWQHETKHAYNEQGLANRVTPDSLPPVEWLTYGSGYLAGMKLGGTPLVEYTRDRLHRETVRSFGSRAGSNAAYELTSTYTPAGQLQSQHLNSLVYDRDYGWNDNGDLVRISGPRQTREYGYSATGRLESVRTLAPDLDIRIPYATDPAGNRLPDPELHPDSTLTAWPDNRIAEDAHYVYHYDEYGRLTEKTDRIPTGVIRTDDERTHHYHYDSQHRLVFHTRIQHGEPLVESRYLYDPLGRRMAKRVWRRERDLTGWMSLSRKPEETWYGWDGDRLTTVQTDTTRIQTVYQPGSFAPLIRIETDNGEREKAQRRSLAEKLQQEGSEDGHGVVFPAELVRLLDRLEEEIRADRVSSESRQWLAQCGLTVEQLARQVEPEYTPARKVHFYHCDHRGLPLALISEEGNTVWSAEYDEWGNLLNEENPHHLHQPYRLPGQQHDEESGLYYNRHRYYDPLQGRYITQDPIGLEGGWNLYNYPLNPIIRMDPLGLYNLYQLLYDVWHDDSYGTSSIDITGSGDLISLGGHAGLGVAFAKKKGEMLSDICIYATACGHAGIGGGINAAITYSETKSLPTSGVSNSVGVTVGGGVGGHFAYTYVVDVDNPESSTESVGIGAGVDASVMTLACRTWQECWVN
ncbi:type VI secretion system tip protein VgrG [Escherichia coli]|nr:type VI secretion system tip protein VgrG [Escherichia coli]HAW3846549.1 type VI secretion system tip protein VgrG [Escherichia coli]